MLAEVGLHNRRLLQRGLECKVQLRCWLPLWLVLLVPSAELSNRGAVDQFKGRTICNVVHQD